MRIVYIVAFVGAPLTGALGFVMIRYPRAWAKLNARTAHKKLSEFDSPKQLAHTKQFGKLLLILAALDSLSLLAMNLLGLLK
jgi:hypothetical protein